MCTVIFLHLRPGEIQDTKTNSWPAENQMLLSKVSFKTVRAAK